MENKINSGVIFKNKYKSQDKQPDYRGTLNIEGKEKEIALWVRESAGGVKYFSAVLTEVYVADKPAPKDYQQQEEENSDLPF